MLTQEQIAKLEGIQLTDMELTFLKLRYVKGMSVDDIGLVFDVSRQWAGKIISRATEKAKVQLNG